MDKAKPALRRKEFAVAVAAGVALLWASLANFITHNDYPVLRPEIGLVALLCVVIAFMVTPIYLGQRQWGRSFLEGLLGALFVDLNSNSVAAMVAAGVAVAAITYWKRISLLGPLALFGTVILVATLVGSRPSWLRSVHKPSAEQAASNGKPAILHLILDEHIGVEGLPADEESQHLKQDLKAFYLRRGFALYGRAYSQHMHTVNAIPAVLNYGERLAEQPSTTGVVVGQTQHLRKLVDQGYRLTIFQSDFADFCSGAAFAECVTYDSSSLRPTLDFNLSPMERTRLIALKFASLSQIIAKGLAPWNVAAAILRQRGVPMPVVLPTEDARTSTVGTLRATEELSSRLSKARSGDAFFAHLLLPHYPYVVGPGCAGLRFTDWKRRWDPSPLEIRRHAYAGQLHCTMSKVDQLLKALARSPAGLNAIVIIHGDHGSRLTTVDPNEPNRGSFTDDDMIAGYSTLFAIRAPGVQPGYLTSPQPISLLLRDFTRSGFTSAPRPAPPQVHLVTLDDFDWKPRGAYPLPPAWLK